MQDNRRSKAPSEPNGSIPAMQQTNPPTPVDRADRSQRNCRTVNQPMHVTPGCRRVRNDGTKPISIQAKLYRTNPPPDGIEGDLTERTQFRPGSTAPIKATECFCSSGCWLERKGGVGSSEVSKITKPRCPRRDRPTGSGRRREQGTEAKFRALGIAPNKATGPARVRLRSETVTGLGDFDQGRGEELGAGRRVADSSGPSVAIPPRRVVGSRPEGYNHMTARTPSLPVQFHPSSLTPRETIDREVQSW